MRCGGGDRLLSRMTRRLLRSFTLWGVNSPQLSIRQSSEEGDRKHSAISCVVPGAALETVARALYGAFVEGRGIKRPLVTGARLTHEVAPRQLIDHVRESRLKPVRPLSVSMLSIDQGELRDEG
jgi:hypothetical protein